MPVPAGGQGPIYWFLPLLFRPWIAPAGTLLTVIVSAEVGMSHAVQWTKSPPTASGSWIISAKLLAPSGTPIILSGGLTFWPLQVYWTGMAAPSRKTWLNNFKLDFGLLVWVSIVFGASFLANNKVMAAAATSRPIIINLRDFGRIDK